MCRCDSRHGSANKRAICALDKCVLLMRMHIHTPVHDTTFEPRITVSSTTSLLSSSLPLTIYTSEKRKERAREKEGKGREEKGRKRENDSGEKKVVDRYKLGMR